MTTAEGYVHVEGGRLWYERGGGGFPVVLIHPRPWDARIWDDQFEAFAARHDVIRYDRRGSGRSDPPAGAFSELRDLLYLLEELDVGRCALVGCGSGAELALDAALASRTLVDALVLVAPGISGYRWSDPGLPVLESEVRRALVSGEPERAMDMILAVWTPSGVDPASDGRVRDLAMDNREGLATWDAMVEAPPPAVDRLEDVTAATLILVGDRDLGEVHAIADLLAERVPGARKRVIAEADQLVNVRRPERFNRSVLEFLSFRA